MKNKILILTLLAFSNFANADFQFKYSTAGMHETANHYTMYIERTGDGVGVATLDYATTDGNATAGEDYEAVSGQLYWASGDLVKKSVWINHYDDLKDEPNESFVFTISNPTGGVITGTDFLNVTISDDDVLVTDTDGDGVDDAVDICPNDPLDLCNCPTGPIDTDGDGVLDLYDFCPNDATNTCAVSKYIKRDSTGAALTDQTLAWNDLGSEAANDQWSCVEDTETGLIWEVKVNDASSIHDYTNNNIGLSWYDSSEPYHKGLQTNGNCFGSICNTEDMRNETNTESLCGFSDWRLPHTTELASLIADENSVLYFEDGLADPSYFPYFQYQNINTWTNTGHWTLGGYLAYFKFRGVIHIGSIEWDHSGSSFSTILVRTK